jgi:prepilin-type N-terminal cleavage/methylation domain-containing protein
MPGLGSLRDARGFTLTELLVTLAVLGLVMGAAAQLQVSSGLMLLRGENQAEAHQAARAVMLMEDDLRMTGYGYPISLTRITAATATSVTFWADVTNGSTTLSATANAGATTLTVGTNAGFKVGDTLYLINGNQWESRTIASLGGGTTITLAAATGASYPQGSQVGRAKQLVYAWAGGTLTKDSGDGAGAQVIATGIQTFQFSYFSAADTSISTPVSAANLPNIRRVRITATAQSAASLNRGAIAISSDVRPRNL